MTSSDPERGENPGSGAGWRPPPLALAVPEPPATVDEAPEESPEAVRERAYAEGLAEGLAAGRAQSEAIAAEMSSLLQAMAAPFRNADAVLVREITALVERVAVAVIDRELDRGGYDLEALLEQSLQVLGSVDLPVQLTVNPADAALCRALQQADGPPLEMIEDARLQRGGIRLKAGNRIVDASIETRLEEVLASLREGAGLPDPEPEDGMPGASAGDAAGASADAGD